MKACPTTPLLPQVRVVFDRSVMARLQMPGARKYRALTHLLSGGWLGPVELPLPSRLRRYFYAIRGPIVMAAGRQMQIEIA